MSFDIGLSKPDMRAATENELRLIAMGQKNRAQVSDHRSYWNISTGLKSAQNLLLLFQSQCR